MTTRGFVFTGRHMLIVMLAFFGTVVAVNVLMAVLASRSFTGLLAVNGYVASIDYAADEAERRHAAALGWTIRLGHDDGVAEVAVTRADGAPVALDAVTATTEPATGGDPAPLAMAPSGSGFRATQPLPPGNWVVRARVESGTEQVTKRAVVSVR
jgi:nitrogen fixation protein FixH